MAHTFSKQNSLGLVTITLKQALQIEVGTDGLVLHRDQEYHYTSHSFFALTREYYILASMSRRGNCWDNAPMESFFGHPKEEVLLVSV